jgi:hypothetical protein
VNPEVLNFFISSCEEELKDERQIAIRTIKKMGFNPVSSEKRPASYEPIERLNEARVSWCNVYVGIFGTAYSKPTIDEYHNAVKGNRPTLIFKKNCVMDPELTAFISSIKSASTGNTYKEFDHVVEFGKGLKESIIYLVSKSFRRPADSDKKEIVEYMEQPSKVPKLGEGTIEDFDLPKELSKGEFGTIRVYTKGHSDNSFLDLLLVDPEGKQQWYVNPSDIDQNIDKGIRRIDGDYRAEWIFEIYQIMKPGSYIAFIGLYEDTYSLPTVNRRLLDFKIQTMVIREKL